MTVFSAANIGKAIARVPTTASRDLRTLLERARERSIDDLVKAIEAELVLRGSVDFDVAAAQRHAQWSERSATLDLTETIRLAFAILPMNPDERDLAFRIRSVPGISYQSLVALRGKGDVGLVLGHMIYERLGFFRRFLSGQDRMSDLLFDRMETGGQVTYRLTPEAEAAFAALGV